MKYKKGLIFICLIIFLISIAGACAGDVNETAAMGDNQITDTEHDDVLTAEEQDLDDVGMVEDESNASAGTFTDSDREVLCQPQDDALDAPAKGTFSQLQDLINTAEGSSITLQRDYVYDKDFTYLGINITRPLTIYGNGHTLDGANDARIFELSSDNIVLINIRFYDASHFKSGGAILAHGSNCRIINSTFIKNKVHTLLNEGGAIYAEGDNLTVINSTFTENSADLRGGAISSYGANSNIINCIFKNNHAVSMGGAIWLMGNCSTVRNSIFENGNSTRAAAICAGKPHITVANSTFKNNHAEESSAIYASADNFIVLNCTFENNNATYNRGTVYLAGKNSTIANSIFRNNSGFYGSAICSAGAENTVKDSIFIDCTAECEGTIYSYGDNFAAINSTFINCNSTNKGGVLRSYAANCTVINSTFMGCFADDYGGVIYATGKNLTVLGSMFKNCSSSAGGGAIYFYEDGLLIMQSTFINCTAENGGAVNSHGNNVYIVNSLFMGNHVDGWAKEGGAIISSAGNSNVINCTFTDNHGVHGGAVSIYDGTVMNCRFTQNHAGRGGAVYLWQTVNVTNSYFINNSADGGAGIYIDGFYCNITDSLFINNSAADGGAIYVWADCDYNNVSYCTFKGNSVSEEDGGIIFWYGNHGTVAYCNLDTEGTSPNFHILVNDLVIKENRYRIITEDVSKYYGGSEKLTIRLTDTNGAVVPLVKVTFTANGKSSTATTDSRGQASFDLNLPVGTHYTICQYDTVRIPSVVSVKSTVEVSDVSGVYMDSQATARFLDANGNPLSSKQVAFKAEGRTYSAVTNANGVASTYVNLDAGTHTVTAVNLATNEQKTFRMIISKAASSFTLTNEASTLIASLTPDTAGGEIIFNFNGTQYSRPILNGRATLTLYGLGEGNYNASASYAGDGNLYASPDETLTFTISPSIIMNDAVGEYLSTKVTATFLNADGSPLTSTPVTFIVDGRNYSSTTDTNGVATADIDLSAGNYKITTLNPTTAYQKSANLTISKASSELSLAYAYTGANVVITASITPGSPGGEVIFTFNGTEYPRLISNGKATLSISDFSEGKYNVTAAYTGDSNLYASANKTLSFTVNPSIILNDAEGTYLNTKVTATFLDINNNPLASRQVTFKIANKTYTTTTDTNGIATADIDLGAGNYNVTTTNPQTGKQKSARVTISKANSELSLEYTYTGANTVITATLTPVSPGGEVIFAFNGTQYPRSISNGKAALSITDLSEGKYNVSARYTGDSNLYASANKTLSFTVNPSIIMNDAEGTYLNTKVTATFLDINNNPLASRQVTFKIANKTYTATTDTNGVATANIDLGAGNYNVTTINPQTGKQKSARLTISKANSSIALTYTQNRYGVTVTAELSPGTAGGKVTFTFLGESFTRTISNGKASFTRSDLSEGNYVVSAGYAGDSNLYASSDKTFTFTVRPSIIIDDAAGAYLNTRVSATFLDGDLNPLVSKIVTFKAAGKSYTATTNANGVAVANIDLDAGNYNVTAVNPVTGDEKTVKLTISKADSSLKVNVVKTNGRITLNTALTPDTATGKVKFYFQEKRITFSYTIVNGKATLESIYTEPGVYNVIVSYDGDNNLNAAQAKNITFTIPKPVLSANSVSSVYGSDKNVVISLKESDGTPIVSKQINVVFKGVHYTYSATEYTNQNGQIVLSTKDMMPDAYSITAQSDGCDQITSKLTIKKATPKLTAKAKTFKKSVKTKKYSITLKTNQNKPMKKVKVTIKINKKTYTAKTNNKGVATFKITKLTKKGNFKSTVTYKGDKYYNKVTKIVKIKIK